MSYNMSTTTTMAIPERTSSSRTGLLAVLFRGFALSGIATTIIGPILPVFIRKWGLDDGQAGLFPSIQFLAALVGTGVSGAWMAWRGYRPSLVAGYALMGFGLATLNAGTHVNALAAATALGLGYGLITPGTNLYVADAGGARSASLLNLLNLAWGVGAMACSPLMALALLFGRFGVERHEKAIVAAGATPLPARRGVTIALAALFFMYVGMET